MKFKVRFNRRYSVFITLFACAASIWMLVRMFDFPLDMLVRIALICVVSMLIIVLLAAPIAFIGRWFADRRKR